MSDTHTCPICPRSFTTPSGMAIHLGRRHPDADEWEPQTEMDRKFDGHDYVGPTGPCSWRAPDGMSCGAPRAFPWHQGESPPEGWFQSHHRRGTRAHRQ